MPIAISAVLLAASPMRWSSDWAWGLPLIVVTVLVHVAGLELINLRVVRISPSKIQYRHTTATFVMVIGITVLLVTCLHGVEAAIWAITYRVLGALPNNRDAMLYSLEAVTSYGHDTLSLEKHWQLMGAIEALNGWLLFGLTTAFLFGVIDKWLSGHRGKVTIE